MSREIKFRCWVANEKYMLEPITLQEMLNYAVEAGQADISNGTMMQFTGIRDVNGVEIYEEDIVKVPGIGKAEVKLSPHYGVVYIASDDGSAYEVPYADCASEGDYPTILGNIYEHPHLLDESK